MALELHIKSNGLIGVGMWRGAAAFPAFNATRKRGGSRGIRSRYSNYVYLLGQMVVQHLLISVGRNGDCSVDLEAQLVCGMWGNSAFS
jgi:hypothetical protein